MRIQLSRISNERHRLRVLRAPGDEIERELETRSVLLHDLVHFALESEAATQEGFWGLLAAGADFDELLELAKAPTTDGLMRVERLVGPLQAVWHESLSVDDYLRMAGNEVLGDGRRVDRDFVEAVLERLRRLWGRWRATGFHDTMELAWPPAA